MDIASLLIPLLLTAAALWALRKRIDVYDALTAGAAEGLLVLARIAPSLIALLTAVYMLRASGALTLLTRLLTPVLERLGIPPETAALLLVRPVSGSGALAVGSGDAGLHGDHLLHHRRVLRRGGHPPHPLHRSGGADRRSGGVHGGGVERAAVLRHMKKAHPWVRFLRMVTFSPAQSSRSRSCRFSARPGRYPPASGGPAARPSPRP